MSADVARDIPAIGAESRLVELDEAFTCFILSFLHSFTIAGPAGWCTRSLRNACNNESLCAYLIARDLAEEESQPLPRQPSRAGYGEIRPRPTEPAALNLQLSGIRRNLAANKSGSSSALQLHELAREFCSQSLRDVANAAASDGRAGLLQWVGQQTSLLNVDGNGRNALMVAAMNNRPMTVAAAIAYCELGQQHAQFGTALHMAAWSGASSAVAELCQRGAPLEAVNRSYGQTPLHVASSRDHVEVVRLLLEAQADYTAMDRDGLTALRIARSMRSPSVEALLQVMH